MILFRDTVKGVWFSEELKMAKNYGYKIKEITSCVQFDKDFDIFHSFVNTLYEFKKEAENNKQLSMR